MKNSEVYQILKKRFPAGEYALLQEVSDAAGFSRSRSADFIAMGFWPSRGLSVHGIEQKASRTDWLKELKDHKKAENIFQYSDYFWLLTTAMDGIAKLEEIPETWGWMAIKGDKIKVMKEAPKLTPVALSKHFVVAMLKRACGKDFVHVSDIEERINQAKQSGLSERDYQNEQAKRELKELQEIVDEFQSASGITIRDRWRYHYTPKETGEVVKLLLSGGVPEIEKKLQQLHTTASNIANNIQSHLTELNGKGNKDRVDEHVPT
jgi:hypothetical protein